MVKNNTINQSSSNRNIPLAGKFTMLMTFIVLILSYPYVINRLLPLPSEQLIGIIILLIMGCVNLNSKGKSYLPNIVTVFFLIQTSFWLLYCCYHADYSYIVRIFYLILTFLITSNLIKYHALTKFIQINNIVVTVQAVAAAIGFILVLVGVLQSLGDYTNIDSRPFHWYGLTCSNVRLGNFIRVSGFFDEPGALAYWGIFALIFNKLFYGNKVVEVCLIVSLFFTLSAAYFVQIFMYFVCFSKNKKGILLVIIIGLIVTAFISNLEDNDLLMHMTVDRFDENGIKSKRSELAVLAKGYFEKYPFLGMGAQNMENTAYMADNPYEIPAKDGIIGTIITYLPYIYILLKYGRRKEVFCSILILGAGYLQRPFHVNEIHNLMMYSFILMVILKYNGNEKKCKSLNSNHLLQLS